jgi:hypothetical protein
MTAMGLASGMAGFLIGAALPPTRWVLEKFVVPKPGEGPSETSQQRGSYDLRFYGTTSKGNTLTAKVTGDMDPGYGPGHSKPRWRVLDTRLTDGRTTDKPIATACGPYFRAVAELNNLTHFKPGQQTPKLVIQLHTLTQNIPASDLGQRVNQFSIYITLA